MRWPIRAYSQEYLIVSDPGSFDEFAPMPFETPGAVQLFLDACCDDHFAMASLRAIVGEYLQGDVHRLNDRLVTELIASALDNGILRIMERVQRVISGGQPRPYEEPREENDDWPRPAPVPERPPKPDHPDEIGSQASTLIAAARDGVPFCEECEKAKRALAAASGG